MTSSHQFNFATAAGIAEVRDLVGRCKASGLILPPKLKSSARGKSQKEEIRAAMKKFLAQEPGEFSVEDFAGFLAKENIFVAHTTAANWLERFRAGRVIDMAVQGHGGKASLYRKGAAKKHTLEELIR